MTKSELVKVISERLGHVSQKDAEVVVNRKSQKGMLIGKGGKAIKKLGTNARKVIEDFVGKKVFLDLNVKVREKWREI